MSKKITVVLSDKAEQYFSEIMYSLTGKNGEGSCTQADAINESLETLADFEKMTDNQLSNWNDDFDKLSEKDKGLVGNPTQESFKKWAGNERTAEDVETPAEVTKYLEECFSEINSIYGAVKKVAIYGGSAFAIYEGQECYKVSFQSYNQNTVTLDAATAPSK